MQNLIADFQALTTELATRGPGGSVEFLLEQMEPESARYLRLCAIPHQFDADILRVLAPWLSAIEADEECRQFAELPVVTFTPYGMALHDKARRQLFEQWIGPPINDEFVGASGRLVDYLAFKKETNLSPGLKETLENVWMFHLFGADQVAGFDVFQEQCRKKRRQFQLDECEHLITLVHEYDAVLLPEHHQWLRYHEAKLAADRCQWDRAQKLFSEVLKNDPLPVILQITATNRLGMVHDERRNYGAAIDYYERALKLAQLHPGFEKFTHRILNDLGAAHRDKGNLEAAERIIKQSIDMAQRQGSPSGMAVGYNSLGTLFRKKRETWDAIDAFKKSLEYLKLTNDSLRPAQVYNNLGLVYRELGDWKQSKHFFEQSTEISRQIGDSAGLAKTLNNLIIVYSNLKNTEQAIDAASQAIRLFEEVHDTFNAALTKRNLGKLYRKLRRPEEAIRAFSEAITKFARCNAFGEAAETEQDLIRLQRSGLGPWLLIIGIVGGTILIIGLLFVIAILRL